MRGTHAQIDVSAKERLIVALDFNDASDARRLVEALGDTAAFYKVHWVLLLKAGGQFIEELVSADKKVFLDLKMWDIDETVENAVRAVSEMGVEFVTLHGSGATIRAAQRGRAGRRNPRLLGVTLLSSLGPEDLEDLTLSEDLTIEQYVHHRARQLLDAGCDGLIASGQSVAHLRETLPEYTPTLVTPGVRPAGSDADDHKRTLSPAEAIAAGSDYLVVGRPIYAVSDPVAAARRIVGEIDDALAKVSD